jgi:hypothetical protein
MKPRSTIRKASAAARNTDNAAPPRVFLSHASEDKERFVVDFATRLRQRGIDVWLDRWEMLPGDSLVQKIFEEGMAEAVAVIVVVSKHSIAKPWVREELNVAVVRKINKSSKLIPVVIDECVVPECLQATIWEKINDLKDYEANLDRIVLSIFGRSHKPPVGAAPAFTSTQVVTIDELTSLDSLVLQTACEICLETNDYSHLQLLWQELTDRVRKLGVSEAASWEGAHVLKSRDYLKIEPNRNLQITFSGFEAYLKAHRPDYEKLLKKFASLVVNEGLSRGEDFERSMELPLPLLEHITEVFAEKGWIMVERYGGGKWEIVEDGTSPELKRWLEA